MDWRARNAEREKDPVRNCQRCEHYYPTGRRKDDGDGKPFCAYWTQARGYLYTLGTAESPLNQAPFCNVFSVRRPA